MARVVPFAAPELAADHPTPHAEIQHARSYLRRAPSDYRQPLTFPTDGRERPARSSGVRSAVFGEFGDLAFLEFVRRRAAGHNAQVVEQAAAPVGRLIPLTFDCMMRLD